MRIRVRFFAGLREQLGATRELDVPDGTTVGAVWAVLAAERPRLRRVPVRYAVKERYVDASHALADRDEVAVFPPVSGG